jgi:hypothetical protein
MNQLSTNVIHLARDLRARDPVSCAASPRFAARPRNALTCRWRRDAVTGRAVCAWTTKTDEREAQPLLRRTLRTEGLAA